MPFTKLSTNTLKTFKPSNRGGNKCLKAISLKHLYNRDAILFFLIFFGLHASGFSQTYITNVTVADVEKQVLLPNHTVILSDDLISDIQPAHKVKIPEKAVVIDGTDKFLIPGLTDAHVHFFQNGGLYTRPDAIDLQKYHSYANEIQLAKDDMSHKLKMYLKNGITNVIDVGAPNNFLKQRELYKDNDSLPTVFITGPLATTYEPEVYKNLHDDEPFNLVKTVEEAVNSVRNQLPLKPDFIKIWYIVGADGLSVEESAKKNLPIVKAVIDEAHKNNLKVAVHATQRITAQLAVENGANFLVHSIDDEVLKDDFIQLMKRQKIILCPTLTVREGYSKTFGQKHDFSEYELLNADAFQLGTLLDLKHLPDTALVEKYKMSRNSETRIAAQAKSDSICKANLKLLVDAGVVIATGTDAGNIGTLHASSYLAELKAMQAAGMTNWQILTASTLNGARVVSQEHNFGSISKGKKANLVLLNANPVEHIENVANINRIINNGIVFSPADLIKDSPADLAQRQLNAYNLRNIDAFLEPYAEDVEIFRFPNTLLSKGKDDMRAVYSKMFENIPDLHCELVNRIVLGNTVIDHESVQDGIKKTKAIAIYKIENSKIRQVYFISQN